MTGVPSVFGFPQIALTAFSAFVASLFVLWISTRRSNPNSWGERFAVAGVVGFSVLFWRLAGNVPQLNDDPIPPISPNDVLCPMVTYVLLGLYAALRRPKDTVDWDKTRAWLTLVSFVVNVLVI